MQSIYKLKLFACFCGLLAICHNVQGQEQATFTENIRAKGTVTSDNTIKLRWAPANPKAWFDGKKYGYIIEKHIMMVDNVWQETPQKQIIDTRFIPSPLAEWERQALKSDYAAVIAQAFYGEDFELSSSSGDIGGIINQANELEQRFSTSVFMAEYDYKAAELAGWAWTDKAIKDNEKYLYRIYLNRPTRLEGDTAAVYIGFDDKKGLPKPIGLNVMFGDKAAMLSWNYTLLSDTYHSYHIERMAAGGSFRRITELPATVLKAEMQEIFYTDSLPDNETVYSYRVIGLSSFDEEGPVSDTISGQGLKTVSCVPNIFSGYFVSKDKAHVLWEFDCKEPGLVDKMQVLRSGLIDGDFTLIEDNIPVQQRDQPLHLQNELNYVKVRAVNKDGSSRESFPFLIRQVDSVPPAIPTGLKVEIDTAGVAHLSWDANPEKDFRGYRVLRSFTEEGEQSSITSEFIPQNHYTDTLSLFLGNPNVYYSLTALDIRYNESLPCESVKAAKPNNATPDEPVITGYQLSENKVTINWLTNTKHPGITYTLIRTSLDNPEYTKAFAPGDYTVTSYTDEIPASGAYRYSLVATGTDGKKSISPQPLNLDITVDANLDGIAGFTSYADTNKGYIELSWKKHGKAKSYRIYKAGEDGKMSLWKELDASQHRVVDEVVSAGTKYSYTIVFLSEEGRTSKAKTIAVNY